MTREEELKEIKYRKAMSVVMLFERKKMWAKCECPTCEAKLYVFERHPYCPHCGQKLDWSALDD